MYADDASIIMCAIHMPVMRDCQYHRACNVRPPAAVRRPAACQSQTSGQAALSSARWRELDASL
jgi:hypothetical protein